MDRWLLGCLLGSFIFLVVIFTSDSSNDFKKCDGNNSCSEGLFCAGFTCYLTGREEPGECYNRTTRWNETQPGPNGTTVLVPKEELKQANCSDGFRCEVGKRIIKQDPETSRLFINSTGTCREIDGKPILCGRDWHCRWYEKCVDGKCTATKPRVLRSKPPCTFNEDCWGDHFCLQGSCHKRPFWEPTKCKRTAECSRGKLCHGGMCVIRSTVMNGRSNSELCQTDGQCRSRLSCDAGLCVGLNFRMILCNENEYKEDSCGGVEGYKCRTDLDITSTGRRYSVCANATHLESKKECLLDQDCPLGEVCHQVKGEPSRCHLFFLLYRANQCSWDGHCWKGNCIRSAGAQIGTCQVTATRPERPMCETKADCAEHYYCSFGRCTYPQRRMNELEPLPCLTDDECPSQRFCFHNGCVKGSHISDNFCSHDSHCERQSKYEERCLDGWCVAIGAVPWTEVTTKDEKTYQYKSYSAGPEWSTKSLGFPAPSGNCLTDSKCVHGELCRTTQSGKNICHLEEPLERCDSKPCSSDAYVCHHGRCLAILNIKVWTPDPPIFDEELEEEELAPHEVRHRVIIECLSDLSCKPSEMCDKNRKCKRAPSQKKVCDSDFDCEQSAQCLRGHCHERPEY